MVYYQAERTRPDKGKSDGLFVYTKLSVGLEAEYPWNTHSVCVGDGTFSPQHYYLQLHIDLLRRPSSWTPLICVEIFRLAARYRLAFGLPFVKMPAVFLDAKIIWTRNSRSKATVCLCLRQKQVPLIWLLGTWFRFLIKHITRDSPSTDISYAWDKIGFFTNWLPADQHVILCFDLPGALQSRLQSALSSSPDKFSFNNPYSLHATIVEEVVSLFDISVWSFRDAVRMIEKVPCYMIRFIIQRLTLAPRIEYPQNCPNLIILTYMNWQGT